jgi:sulfate/thiosulfate transport system permease protein
MRARPSRGQLGLRIGVIAYLGLLVAAPVFMVFRQAFGRGLSTVWDTLTSQPGVHALEYTLLMAAIAVPLNAIMGVGWGLMLARGPRWLRGPLGAVLNLPFAVPPVVVGLALLLIYGRTGWFGPWLQDNGIQFIFSWPGMALATVFISLPFVAREVVPVLREVGTDQEEAARTLGATAWQAFRHVTLPAIFPAVAYGVVLTTARAIGEFGAVSVVSGRIVGQTETLPLFVENRYDQFDRAGAYSAAVLLAVLALLVLALMVRLQRRDEVRAWPSTP